MKQIFILPYTGREHAIQRLARFLAVCIPQKRVKITVEQYVKRRTVDQNAALWGLAYKRISEKTGHDPKDLHVYFCGEHFGWVTIDVMGEAIRKPRRTTTSDEHGKPDVLSTVQFSEFFELVRRKAAEVGIFVDDPDPNWHLAEAG